MLGIFAVEVLRGVYVLFFSNSSDPCLTKFVTDRIRGRQGIKEAFPAREKDLNSCSPRWLASRARHFVHPE